MSIQAILAIFCPSPSSIGYHRPVTFPCSRRVRRTWWRPAVLLGALVGLAAPLSGLLAQTVAEVQVTPETMTIGVNQKQTIFAAAYDRQGNLIPTAKFTFWSSDTMIARVGRDGTVLGVQPGLAKVEARVQGRRASLAVLVTGGPELVDKAPPGAVLTLDPARATLLPGENLRLLSKAALADGTDLPLTRITWTSLNPDIATVDTTGVVTGVAVGNGAVQATTANGLTDTVLVEVATAEFAAVPERVVIGPQQIDTVRIRVPSQNNRRIDNGIRWQAADTTIAAVGLDGIVRGRTPGTTEILAAGFGQERRIPVIVHKAPAALVVTPKQSAGVQLPRTGVRKFSVIAEAADSTPIHEVVASWSLQDTAIATFDPATGTLAARAVGTTKLTATVTGFAPVVWTIDVVPGFLRLSADRIGLIADLDSAVTAALTDDAGQPAGAVPALRWASDRPEIATVNAAGRVHGVAPGRALITATTPWGQSDTITVFVTGDFVIASNRGGTFDLYTARMAMPERFIRILDDDGSDRVGGIYSPDRTYIAFSSNRAGTYDLYVADADGANPRRLTVDSTDEREPAWSADGLQVLYTATQPSGRSEVRTVDVAQGTSRALFADTGAVSYDAPAMAPDGSIAVVSTRDKRADVYVARGGRGAPAQVTDNVEREIRLQFLPTGDLIYAAERGRGKSARIFRRPPGTDESSKLFDTDQPLAALAVARDGLWMVYAVGKVTDRDKGQAKFTLYIRPVGSGNPTLVPLRADEQIASLSF